MECKFIFFFIGARTYDRETDSLPFWFKKKRAVGPCCFTLLPHGFINDVAPLLPHPFQEEVARLAALQPQVDLLEKRLNELKGEKEGEEDPSAFLDADINAFKEHYHKVLEDLRARERQLQLGERRQRR